MNLLKQFNLSNKNILARGFEGEVILSKCNKYVLKIFHTGKFKHYYNEKEAVEKLKDEPYIIKALESHTFETKKTHNISNIYHGIVYPYYRLGNAHKFNSKIKTNRIIKRCKHIENVFNTLWYGINSCHNNNICHRDIKPANILIENKNNNKSTVLTDFGLSTKCNIIGNNRAGTRIYAAPEIFTTSKLLYTYKVDIWSAGITWLEMCIGNYNIDYIKIKLYGYKEIEANHSNLWRKLTPMTQFILENSLQVNPEFRLDSEKFIELF